MKIYVVLVGLVCEVRGVHKEGRRGQERMGGKRRGKNCFQRSALWAGRRYGAPQARLTNLSNKVVGARRHLGTVDYCSPPPLL